MQAVICQIPLAKGGFANPSGAPVPDAIVTALQHGTNNPYNTPSQGLLNTATASGGGALDNTKVQNMPSMGLYVFYDLAFVQEWDE